MTLQTFIARIEDSKVNNLIYQAEGKEGLVSVWKHEGAYVLTWEECPQGQQYDESEYTRDEREQFSTIGQLIDYLDKAGVKPESFTP